MDYDYDNIHKQLGEIQSGNRGCVLLQSLRVKLPVCIQGAMDRAKGNAEQRAELCRSLLNMYQEKEKADKRAEQQTKRLNDVTEEHQEEVKRFNAKLQEEVKCFNAKLWRTRVTAALCFAFGVAMLVFYALLSLRAYRMQNTLRALPPQCHEHVNPPSLLHELGMDLTKPPADGGTANALPDRAGALPATGGFW